MNKLRLKILINKRPAAVLILTLLFLAGISFLVQQFVRHIAIYSRFASIEVAQQQAKMLAIGGINLAISQLLGPPKNPKKPASEETLEEVNKADKKDEKRTKTSQEDEDQKKLLERILPHLNRWQVFKLDEKLDGIEGEIKFCISSEEGKINLNEVFDFEKKEIKKEFIPLLERIKFKTKSAEKIEISKVLGEFFKKRNKKLDDVAEIHALPEFKDISLFYTPPRRDIKKGETEQREEYLYDLFTIWSGKPTIDILFLSDDMCEVLKIRRPLWNDSLTMKDKFKQLINGFKTNLGSNIVQNWPLLQHIYEKKPNELEKIQRLFSQKFDPRVYTVLSSGTVRGIEQKVMAIISQSESEDEQPDKAESSDKKENKETKESEQKIKKQEQKEKNKNFDIIRFYWL